MTHRGPFQPLPFCDSGSLLFRVLPVSAGSQGLNDFSSVNVLKEYVISIFLHREKRIYPKIKT